MYRIRSASGTEVSYNSLEEFSAAVRRGEVHPEDEIFHTRANRWLDVKSHPHYRSATTWAHHEPAAATAPRSPVSPAQPQPRAPQGAVPAPSPNSSSRAQVFERPVVRTAPQTTVRPQLQAAPAPAPVEPAPAPQPPRKSKELAFIDLGDAAPKAKAAPAEPVEVEAPAPAPPPAPSTPLPKLELRHLPKLAPKAPITAQAAPAPAPTPTPAPPPAPKAAGNDAVTGPGSEVDFLVMDGGIESPVRNSAGYKTVPEDLDLLFDAPLPQNAGQPGEPVRGHAVAGVPPKGAPTNRSGKTPAVQVPADSQATDAASQLVSRIDPDLEIPSGSLLESENPAPAPVQPPRAPGKSNAMLFGGGLAIIAVAATLLAWRPWKGGGAVADASAQPQPTTQTQTQTQAPVPEPEPAGPAMVGAPAPTPIHPPVAATTTPSKPAGNKPDAADSATEDQVLAVAKPTFRADVAMPGAADLNLGARDAGTSTGATSSPTELVRRLVTAERLAQQELNNKLAAAGFRNVLSAEHLSSASGVGAARSAWGAGADAIRQFRGRIARLESAYEDSVLSSQRAQRWSSEEMRAWATRQSLAEPTESSQLADLMFSQVNEGLEILAALSGEYSVKGQTISFKNTTSATRYTSIRGWVEQRTSSWTGIPETARPYSVTAILHALGEGFPAVQ